MKNYYIMRNYYEEPSGYGTFSQELNERDETIRECEFCDGKGFDDTISDCCGDTRDADRGLCFYCHDHCDPSPCPDCNGTGIIKTN